MNNTLKRTVAKMLGKRVASPYDLENEGPLVLSQQDIEQSCTAMCARYPDLNPAVVRDIYLNGGNWALQLVIAKPRYTIYGD